MINEKYGNFVRLHQQQHQNGLSAGGDSPSNYTFQETQVLELEAYCSTLSLKLQQWTAISLSLFKQNREYCFHFLLYLQKNQLNKPIYNDFLHQNAKVIIYNNIFALCLARSSGVYSKNNNQYLTTTIQTQFGLTHLTPKQQSQKFYQTAIKYLGHSENVKKIMESSTIIGRGFLSYYVGQMTETFNSFTKSISYSDLQPAFINNENSSDEGFKAVGLIGLAQVSFLKKKYQKALEYYKKALQTYKTLPTRARLGMGYSFYFCSKYQMARMCFKRLLKLDENCVQAYIGLAIIQQKDQNYAQYFNILSQAYKINKDHTLLLLHLAEHYLFKGQYEKSQKYAQKGLIVLSLPGSGVSKFYKYKISQGDGIRNDYEQLRGRLNNVIGQTHHIRQNFDQALKHYKITSTIVESTSNKSLNFNQIFLAQVYTHQSYQNYIEALRILQKIFKNSSLSEVKFYGDILRQIGYLKSKIPPKARLNSSQNGQQSQIQLVQHYYNQAIKYNKNQIEVKIQLANYLSESNKFRTLRLLQSVLSNEDLQQQTLLNHVKIQLLNNIGVLLLENKEIEEAVKYLQKCHLQISSASLYMKQNINQTANLSEEDVKACSLQLICCFNLAIAYEKSFQTEKAKQYYKSILSKNIYFIDASIRYGHILYREGNINEAIRILDQALKLCEQPILIEKTKLINIRFDKIPSMKAYICNQAGQSSKAKQVIKQNFKVKDIYTQIQELGISYQSLMKRQLQIAQLKDFLRPNRELYMKYCHDDPNSAFGYMVLCILLLTDKRVSKQQGLDLFTQLKQYSAHQIPVILYNMGLFLFNYEDYDNCTSIFQTYKDYTLDSRGDEALSLTNLLKGQYDKSLSSIKKNLMTDPSNIKYRFQMIYAYQKKCQKSTQAPLADQKHQFNNKPLMSIGSNLSTSSLQILKKCHAFYVAFSRLNVNQYIKLFESPDFKEKVKNNCIKVKSCSDQRRIYASSSISYHQKFQKQTEQKQKAQKQWKKHNMEKLRNAALIKTDVKFNKIVGEEGQINNEDLQSQDSQQIKIRKRQQNKKKALQLAKQKQMQTQQKWEQLKQKQLQNKKVKKERDPNRKSTSTRKRQKKKQYSQDQQRDYSQEQKSMNPSISNPYDDLIQNRIEQDQQVQAPKRSRKQKERERQRERQRHRERKRIKKQRNNSDSDIERKEHSNEERQSEQSGKDRRKQKKEEEENDNDDLDIDMDKYMI